MPSFKQSVPCILSFQVLPPFFFDLPFLGKPTPCCWCAGVSGAPLLLLAILLSLLHMPCSASTVWHRAFIQQKVITGTAAEKWVPTYCTCRSKTFLFNAVTNLCEIHYGSEQGITHDGCSNDSDDIVSINVRTSTCLILLESLPILCHNNHHHRPSM